MSYDAIVSLGFDCQVAHQLSIHKVRAASMPFDWIVTPFETMYTLIETGFEGFLRRENLRFVVARPDYKYVEDTANGTRFIHDFPLSEDFISTYEQARTKLERRIARFLALLESDATVMLVRTQITRAQAVRLNALLRARYPRLSYLLVALGEDEEMDEDWGLENTRNFRLPPAMPGEWAGDDGAYRVILEQLGINMGDEEFVYTPELYRATMTCESCPAVMQPGQSYHIGVEVRNDSATEWAFDGVPEVRVGYHWIDEAGAADKFDNERTLLPQALPAGHSLQVDALVEAPPTPGRYVLQWDLVIERVAWFSFHGWSGPTCTVRVGAETAVAV